jgi:hypothetical protein
LNRPAEAHFLPGKAEGAQFSMTKLATDNAAGWKMGLDLRVEPDNPLLIKARRLFGVTKLHLPSARCQAQQDGSNECQQALVLFRK